MLLVVCIFRAFFFNFYGFGRTGYRYIDYFLICIKDTDQKVITLSISYPTKSGKLKICSALHVTQTSCTQIKMKQLDVVVSPAAFLWDPYLTLHPDLH